MPNVMIVCPVTKKDVATGLNMDEQSFKSSTLSENSFNCPLCNKTHTWDKKDAFLKKE